MLRMRSIFPLIMPENQAPNSEHFMNIVGPIIRETRIKQGLSQKELVARCNLLGWDISRGTLAKIESKTRKLSDDEVLCLAKALKVETGSLFQDL